MAEILKISSKGQIVIPANIRNKLGLSEGVTLTADILKGFIILKKIEIEDTLKEFERLTNKGIEFARKNKIFKEEDVIKRIHKGRGIQLDKNSS